MTHVLALSCVVLALVSCSSLKPSELPYAQVDPPGFFDIGVGYGRVADTRDTDNDDAEGLIASFKAYPLGRWYSEPKQSELEKGVTPMDRLAVGRIQALSDAERAAMRTSGGAAPAGLSPQQGTTITEAYRALGRLVANEDAKIAPAVRDSLRKLEEGKPLDSEDRKVIEGFTRGSEKSPKWHVIEERNRWYNRFSIFFGRSINDFDSGGLESEVNVVGVGFDVSPDLALELGWAFYEVDEDGTGMIDSDGSLFFGVSLNLFAFKALGESILSVGSEGD